MPDPSFLGMDPDDLGDACGRLERSSPRDPISSVAGLLPDPLDARLRTKAEVSYAETEDLEDSHPGQSKPKDQPVTPPDLRVIAYPKESPECLVMGQPARRVLILKFAVERRDHTLRVLPALQVTYKRRIGLTLMWP